MLEENNEFAEKIKIKIEKNLVDLDYHLHARGQFLRIIICKRPVHLDDNSEDAGPSRMIHCNNDKTTTATATTTTTTAKTTTTTTG